MSDRGQSGASLYFPFMAGFYARFSNYGYPLIRFVTGLMLMPHGAQKLFGMFGGGGLAGTAGFFSKIGLEPAYPLAVLVGCTEFFGGALLAIGLFTRFVSAAVTIMLLVIVFYLKVANGFFAFNGGYEHELLWALVAFGIFLHGAGKLSLDARIGKEF